MDVSVGFPFLLFQISGPLTPDPPHIGGHDILNSVFFLKSNVRFASGAAGGNGTGLKNVQLKRKADGLVEEHPAVAGWQERRGVDWGILPPSCVCVFVCVCVCVCVCVSAHACCDFC